MKNIHNALSQVVEMYKQDTIEYDIIQHVVEDGLYVVNVYNRNAPSSVLQIEVIDDNGIPKCCVLQNMNVGRRSMSRFMNRLVDALE